MWQNHAVPVPCQTNAAALDLTAWRTFTWTSKLAAGVAWVLTHVFLRLGTRIARRRRGSGPTLRDCGSSRACSGKPWNNGAWSIMRIFDAQVHRFGLEAANDTIHATEEPNDARPCHQTVRHEKHPFQNQASPWRRQPAAAVCHLRPDFGNRLAGAQDGGAAGPGRTVNARGGRGASTFLKDVTGQAAVPGETRWLRPATAHPTLSPEEGSGTSSRGEGASAAR